MLKYFDLDLACYLLHYNREKYFLFCGNFSRHLYIIRISNGHYKWFVVLVVIVLASFQDIVLNQITPIRVLHR